MGGVPGAAPPADAELSVQVVPPVGATVIQPGWLPLLLAPAGLLACGLGWAAWFVFVVGWGRR